MNTEPLTDADLAKFRYRVDVYTGPDRYQYEVDGIGYDAHWRHDMRRLLAEVDRLRAENAALLERPSAEPDEEFDAVREHALKVGDKGVKDLLDAFDWLRSELAYSEKIKAYVRKQHNDLEGAFDLVITQCGKLRAERDALAAKVEAASALHQPEPDGLGFRAKPYPKDGDGAYGRIDPACPTCGQHDEYAVPWPCGTARALGLDQDGEGQANADR